MRIFTKLLLMGGLLVSPEVNSQEADGTWNNLPDWLTRTDVSVFLNEDRVSLSIETLQPLFSTEHGGVFFQGRANGGFNWKGKQANNWTFNAGLGARRLIGDTVILGVNAFYDHSTKYNHDRIGAGFEAIGSNVTARVNGYKALSGWKHVSTVGALVTEERALSGIDGEVETGVPYLPWLKASAGGYFWDAKANKDIQGFQAALRGDITNSTKLELGGSIDNYDEKVWARISVSLGARKEVQYTALDDFVSHSPLPKRDLSAQLWQKVLRKNEIVTERRVRNTTTGTTSSAGVFVSGE